MRIPPSRAAEGGAPGQGPWVVPGGAFDLRGTALKPAVRPLLDSIAAALVAQPELRVEIVGNAHDQVTPRENQRLSKERAQAVRDYLVARGVPVTHMDVRWDGANNPLTTGSTLEARTLNRRVEIRRVEAPGN